MIYIIRVILLLIVFSTLSLLYLSTRLAKPSDIFLPQYVEYTRTMRNYINIPENSTIPTYTYLSNPLTRSKKPSNFHLTPISYGYDPILDPILYPKTFRPECKNSNIFVYSGNGVRINCKHTDSPLFFSSQGTKELFGNSSFIPLLKKTEFNATFKLDTGFLFATCNRNRSDILLKFKENQTIFEKVQKTSDKILKETKKSSFDPLTLIIFIIDSASRNGLYRNLPKTLEFLNQTLSTSSFLSEKFRMFEFLQTNSIEPYTMPNISPLLFGRSKESIEKYLKNELINSPKDSSIFESLQRNHSLWSHFSSKGFVTLFIKDEVTDYLSKTTGREILVDHQVTTFWKAALDLYGYNDFNNGDQCIGSSPPYKYSLSYLEDFMKSYKKLNKFAYVHIGTAHEVTGTRLNIADEDFLKFFNETLNRFAGNNENLVFSFLSDHGSAKTDFVSIDGFMERLSNFHIWINSRSMAKKIDFTENMNVNTHRLVSPYDLHFTYKALASYPYGTISEDLPNLTSEIPAKFIFHEQVSETRLCNEAGIKPTYCKYRPFVNISSEYWESKTRFKTLLKLAEKSLNIQGEKINLKSFKVKSVLSIFRYQLELLNPQFPTHYLINFQVVGSDEVLMLHGIVGTHEHMKNLIGSPELALQESADASEENLYLVVRLWEITRLNLNVNLKSHFFHKDFRLSNQFEVARNGENCKHVCENKGLVCSRIKFEWIMAEELAKDYVVKRVGNEDSIEVNEIKNEVWIGRGGMCDMKYEDNIGICQCSLSHIF